MDRSIIIKVDENATHIGVLAQLEQTDKSDTTKNYMRNLKRRAKYHGYSLMKQVLVDYIKNRWKCKPWYKPDYILSISLDCSNSVSYKTFDDIPNEDVPCPCGNPKHWFIRYRGLR